MHDKTQNIIILSVILLAGFAVRAVLLGSVPGGLNQDEASMGYDAWALLNHGMDRNGYRFPVYFVAWGSGQNALYAYLAMPFIALFGLSAAAIRLPAMLIGTFSIFLLYKLAKRTAGQKEALTAAALLAVAPWHIMLSRWSLESNLLPALLLASVYLYISSFEHKRRLWLAAVCFALSLYAYAPAYIVVPLLVIALLSRDLWKKRLSLKNAAVFTAAFFIVSLPLLLFLAVNNGYISEIKTGFFSIPQLTGYRGSEISFSFRNLEAIARILLFQTDGLPWNAVPEFGIVYMFSLPFAVTGLVYSIIQKKSRVMLLWLCAALVMTALILCNINRANAVFIPVIYFTAIGITVTAEFIHRRLQKNAEYMKIKFNLVLLCTAVAYGISFILFASTYFTSYLADISRYFYQPYIQSVNYALSVTDGFVHIDAPGVHMPYVYVLFYGQIPPAEFAETVRYGNPNAPFRQVNSFGRFTFGAVSNINNDTVYIIDEWVAGLFENRGFRLKQFDTHYVAYMPP
jgi:4-amino-4-deoxy-L-arabinose transferase-like glycosyltransferase